MKLSLRKSFIPTTFITVGFYDYSISELSLVVFDYPKTLRIPKVGESLSMYSKRGVVSDIRTTIDECFREVHIICVLSK